MEPETGTEEQATPQQAPQGEPRGERFRRRARRTKLYAAAAALVSLLVIVIALAVANTRNVEVSWVFGSTRQSLIWIILVTAILGWLLGIVTATMFRHRTRRRT